LLPDFFLENEKSFRSFGLSADFMKK